MTAEDDLTAAEGKLNELDRLAKEQRAERNRALKAALASGTTWKRAQEITGLSPRGVQLSIKDD